MEDLVKKLYKMVVEVRKISEANNELLGFICSKIAPADTVVQKEIKDTRQEAPGTPREACPKHKRSRFVGRTRKRPA